MVHKVQTARQMGLPLRFQDEYNAVIASDDPAITSIGGIRPGPITVHTHIPAEAVKGGGDGGGDSDDSSSDGEEMMALYQGARRASALNAAIRTHYPNGVAPTVPRGWAAQMAQPDFSIEWDREGAAVDEFYKQVRAKAFGGAAAEYTTTRSPGSFDVGVDAEVEGARGTGALRAVDMNLATREVAQAFESAVEDVCHSKRRRDCLLLEPEAYALGWRCLALVEKRRRRVLVHADFIPHVKLQIYIVTPLAPPPPSPSINVSSNVPPALASPQSPASPPAPPLSPRPQATLFRKKNLCCQMPPWHVCRGYKGHGLEAGYLHSK